MAVPGLEIQVMYLTRLLSVFSALWYGGLKASWVDDSGRIGLAACVGGLSVLVRTSHCTTMLGLLGTE